MAKRKMKQLALAMGAALGGLSFMPSAQAVHVAQDGLGQVLLFPYYTTQGGWSTLINLTNTSDRSVAVKIRFHEAYNSRDVFDFTLILSPFDVWTAAVENNPGPDGVAGTADDRPQIRTTDNSCTVPPIPISNTVGQPFEGAGPQFSANGTLSYTGGAADGAPTTPSRMKQGYIKVLMKGASNTVATIATPGLAGDAVHGANGVPRNCANLVGAFSTTGRLGELRTAFPSYNEAINPLKGSYNFINVAQGLNAGGNSVALADFYRTADPQVVLPQTLAVGANAMMTSQLPPSRTAFYAHSFHEPNLNSANTLGRVLGANGTLSDSSGLVPSTGANAMVFTLNRRSVINQWTRQTSPPAAWTTGTDWVVTMPSKRYYVDDPIQQGRPNRHEFAGRAQGRLDGYLNMPTPTAPFASSFVNGRSCDSVTFRLFDREEAEFTRDNPPVFSPAPTPTGNELCAEANVISFDESYILDSPRGTGDITSNVTTLPGPHGWLDLVYAGAPTGLPTIGFAIIQRIIPNGLNEAYIIDHAYRR